MQTIIKAMGVYLPKNVQTNEDLSKIIDTNDEWITTRTGITQRYIATDTETTSFMAAEAGRMAIANAALSVSDIDYIIVATTTPEKIFPSTACLVQKHLQASGAACFDVQAVCAGFVYGMSIADSLIKTKQAKNILFIGSERMSGILNWQDRSTCVLFGDGAGAFILSNNEDESNNPKDIQRGIIGSKLLSDGTLSESLYADDTSSNYIAMNGPEVYKHAVLKMTSVVEEVIRAYDIDKKNIKAIIPHQANLRIIEAVGKKLDLPKHVIVADSVKKYANTSAASIPLAAYDLYANKKIEKGDLVITTAIGGGMCWGANIFYL